MADSLCGPSNALQNFQKHTGADRALQQDRLVGRPAQSEGFRSNGFQGASVADREFEAFQNGQAPLIHPEPHHAFAPSQPGSFYSAQSQPLQANSTWTADFQRMNISSPAQRSQQASPFSLQQQPQTWGQDFAQQKQKQVAGPAFAQTAYSPSPFMAPNYQMPMYSGPLTAPQVQSARVEQELAFDEDAFARAFEEAEQAERDVVEETVTMAHQTTFPVNQQEEPSIPPEQATLQTERLGADLIHDPRTGEDTLRDEQNDPDALARTAGNLLDRLQDNHTAKFQNSQFLNLMRQLRDKQLVVEGDKFISPVATPAGLNEVAAPPS